MTTADAKAMLMRRRTDAESLGGQAEFTIEEIDALVSAIEASPNSRTEAITDEMLEAGIQVLTVLYRGDGGWIGKEAAREQVLRTWSFPCELRASTPIAPVRDDDAEWLRTVVRANVQLDTLEFKRLERIANRLEKQSG